MIAIKHRKFWMAVLVFAVLLFMAVFHISYGKINNPKTAFQVKEQSVCYGENLEVEGVSLVVKKPSIERKFSEDYQRNVYLYKIPFEASNITDEEVVFNAENLQIVSGGRAWYGWPYDSYDNRENAETKWGTLKPRESTSGFWLIEVIIDELPEEAYQNYDLYYLNDEGQFMFKYQFIS